MHLVDNIDIQNGLTGGVIIGLSASAMMLLTGKVTGLSGIAEGMLSVKGEDWNFTYITGLCSAGVLLAISRPESFGDTSTLSSATLFTAGMITGFGTRLSGGCTSGHGLCGLPRRSPRSLAAVLTFMTTGAITAYLTNVPEYRAMLENNTNDVIGPLIPSIFASVAGLYVSLNFREMKNKVVKFFSATAEPHTGNSIHSNHMHLVAVATSLAFGLGLGVSGMCNPARVIKFLDFSGADGWDPTLASVLGGGVMVTFAAFHFFKYSETPVVLHPKEHLGNALKIGMVPANLVIDWKLLLGSALFGVGWGMAGMCPGPAMVAAGANIPAALKFVPSMFVGMILKELILG